MNFSLSPIGIIHTPYRKRYEAPRQPGVAGSGAEGRIVLEEGQNFEQALEDLAGFERIWLIYLFDRNTGWRPKVDPPRAGASDGGVRRGVFATRSPHRPNPIGLSLVRLLEVSGRTIRVADVDILDGTPLLDIKPYLPYAEAFPDARAGWLDEAAAEEVRYDVQWSTLAAEQAAFLDAQSVALVETANDVLARAPWPHRYRRIKARSDSNAFELAIRSWRIDFTVAGITVVVERVRSGYPATEVIAAGADAARLLHDGAAHAAFHMRWGEKPNEPS